MVDQNIAIQLTNLLNNGQDIHDALEAAGLEEHEIFGEGECIGLEESDRLELPQGGGVGFELNRIWNEDTRTNVWELSRYEVIRLDQGGQALQLATA